jgi:hypothetical protein
MKFLKEFFNLISENALQIALLLLIVMVMTGFFASLGNSSIEDKRLMQQCLQDHKEYECKAMLNPNCTAAFPINQPKIVK